MICCLKDKTCKDLGFQQCIPLLARCRDHGLYKDYAGYDNSDEEQVVVKKESYEQRVWIDDRVAVRGQLETGRD